MPKTREEYLLSQLANMTRSPAEQPIPMEAPPGAAVADGSMAEPVNPIDQGPPMPSRSELMQDALARNQAAIEPYINEQKKGANALEEILNQYKQESGKPDGLDLSAILGWADSVSGGNSLKSYKAPGAQRDAELAGLMKQADIQKLINSAKGDITKDQLALLNNKLYGAGLQGDKESRQQAAFKQAQELKDQTAAQSWSGQLAKSGLPELGATMEDIARNIDVNAKEDIPGFGQTGSLPQILLSQKGKDTRQSVSELRNVLLKQRSGGAVTPNEAQRLSDELGVAMQGNDEQLRKGIKSVFSKLKNLETTYTGAVRKEVKNKILENGGRVNYLPSLMGSVAAQESVLMSNGKESRMVPPEHIKDAEAEGYTKK